MKKILIILCIFISISSCTYKENKEDKKEDKKIQNIKKQEKFWILTKYIKLDITDEESSKLQKIIKQRNKTLIEIKDMMETSTKENKDETYKKISSKRNEIFSKILVYVAEEKKQSFERYYEKINTMIKNKLYNK